MSRRIAFVVFASLALAACASHPVAGPTPATGSEIEFEGRLASIDTAPWAYDGNASLVVDTRAYGDLAVELPARWNLCRASGIGDAGGFAVGDRVRVSGTVTAPRTVSVCERTRHRIARLP